MPPTTSTKTLRQARAAIIATLAAILLTGCSGIPISSIPRLLKLGNQLPDIKPSEFMIAIQLDARMILPHGGAPVMSLVIEPSVPNAFEAINKSLPMRFVNLGGSALPSNYKLPTAAPGRRWLVYGFTPESERELEQAQLNFKRMMQDKQSGAGAAKVGGKVEVGIAQESIPARDPAFANTRWESWLQTRQSEGFFELWSGTVGTLLKQAGAQR